MLIRSVVEVVRAAESRFSSDGDDLVFVDRADLVVARPVDFDPLGSSEGPP